MTTSIHHMSFTISDMEKSLAFYRDILGMKVVFDSIQGGFQTNGAVAENITGIPGTEVRFVFLKLGNGLIELMEYKPKGKPLADNTPTDIGSSHVCFKTENIQEFYRELSAKGVRFHSAPQKNGKVRVVYFRDPDGIILEAVEEEN